MSTSCPPGMDMRRDGESRGCREAGERDLVIKSSLDSRVYLGHDRLKKRGGMGGCGVPTLTDFTQGQRNTPGVSGSGGWEGKMGVEGYGVQSTVQQVRRYLAADTYLAPDMRVSLYPGRSHGGAARRTAQVLVGTKGGYLGLLT